MPDVSAATVDALRNVVSIPVQRWDASEREAAIAAVDAVESEIARMRVQHRLEQRRLADRLRECLESK